MSKPVPTSAKLSARIAGLGVLLVAAGLLAAKQQWLAPDPSFRVFGVGLLLGLLALLISLIALWSTRASSGRSGRGQARMGFLLGLLLSGVLVYGASPGLGLPTINDISTDTHSPPQFRSAADLPENQGVDMNYPGERFAAQQRAAYPDLRSQMLDGSAQQAFQRAIDAAASLGWQITSSDPGSGHFEAQQTSQLFGFVDDVVVRVRPRAGGSLLDVRSRSRDGRGDLGVNARRIRAFLDALQASP